MLNGVQDNLYSSSLQDALDSSENDAADQFNDALAVNAAGNAQFDMNSEEHSFAQEGVDADMDLSAGMDVQMDAAGDFSKGKSARGKRGVRGKKGKKLQSLRLTTGSTGEKNSQCFACQYFVQRTLGALLGPFYNPAAAGAPAPAFVAPPDNYIDTATPKSAWLRPSTVSAAASTVGPVIGDPPKPHVILAEMDSSVDNDEEDEDEVSFLEVASFIKEAFPVPSAEEAAAQYEKWESYLAPSMIEADAEAAPAAKSVEKIADKIAKKAEAETGITKKLYKKMAGDFHKNMLDKVHEKPVAKKERSFQSVKGDLYKPKDMHAARAFFASLCHRRIPSEWLPTCRALWKKLETVVEELTIGDRPDEICIRHELCEDGSYVHKRSHTVVREGGY